MYLHTECDKKEFMIKNLKSRRIFFDNHCYILFLFTFIDKSYFAATKNGVKTIKIFGNFSDLNLNCQYIYGEKKKITKCLA